jgi:cytochrome c553
MAILALAVAGAAHARGNAEAGKAIAAKVCAECHGADGATPSSPDAATKARTPILAGQYRDYLERALTDYKIGRRNNPIMKGFAAQLSKQEIEDLAAWFAAQKSNLHDQR